MNQKQFKTFEDFWPFYLAEHSQPTTRTLHAIGTTAGLACMAGLIAKGKWKWLPLSLLPGYGLAWIAHFFVEHNKPATFEYPLWSFLADYKMVGMMIDGRIDTELARLGLRDGQTELEDSLINHAHAVDEEQHPD